MLSGVVLLARARMGVIAAAQCASPATAAPTAAPTAPAAAPASPATLLPAQPVSQESDVWSEDAESDIWSEDGSQVEQQS